MLDFELVFAVVPDGQEHTGVLPDFSIKELKAKSAIQWSGRRESNPHNQLGRLKFYH
jgi:hypothetical protein